MSDLVLFLALLAVAYLVPGPDMVLILQTGATQGRTAAWAAASGLALARAAHVGLSAVGLAALLITSPTLFEGLRLAGAAYLAWLGWRIWRSGIARPETGAAPALSPAAAFGRGLLTNIANPKALLFCSVLLPQFVRPEQGNAAGRFVLLGSLLVATGLAFDLAFAAAGARLGRWFDRHPAARRVQGWIFAGLLIGFGVSLVAG
jgi:threonine/homoserine/homoserine lactone efflux protein